MANLKTLLERIEKKQQTISQHGKFDDALLKKINYKLRLDWNYYSNRIEGGTLTKAETRSVMVGNIDVKGKPLRDIMEMSGHDKLVIDVLKLSKGELTLAEKRIKDIHRAIMYEEDINKQTLQVGQWKNEDNEIINYKNEKISFTNWREVPEAVHKLLDKTNAQLEQYHKGKSQLHAVEIAAQFHIDFITIHPFYDGNGRTTRILTNIILMACGYPAVIIKDQHKKSYYQLLGDIQAYGGNPNLFYDFLAERVLDTQALVLDAIAGKDIDELDDIDKEILLFKQELSDRQTIGNIKKNNALIAELYLNNFKLLFDSILEKHKELNELFSENFYARQINNSYPSNYSSERDYIEDEFKILLSSEPQKSSFHKQTDINNIGLSIHHKGFLKDGMNVFESHFQLYIKFDDFQYHIGRWNMPKFSYLYSQILDETLIRKIVQEFTREHLQEIKSKISKK